MPKRGKKNEPEYVEPVAQKSIYDRLRDDEFKNKLPWASPKNDPKVNAAYNAENARLEAEFKAALEKEHGVENHPKKDKLYAKAYEMGHSAGFSEVAVYYDDLVDLIKD